VKLSEAGQTRLGGLVDELRHELEKLAIDEQDKLEWYIEEMQKRAAKLPEQPLSFFYEKLVRCIFVGGMKVEVVDAYWPALEKAFRGFDPEFVLKCTDEELLQEPGVIKHKGKLHGCISAAELLLEIEREFGSFYSFLQQFGISNKPPIVRWSLVCLLANRIPWMGTAIACDFLKDVGLAAYAKPDVHVKRALHRHNLIQDRKEDDFTCFVAVDRLAQASGLEPAYIDRILWVRGQKFRRW
jgi:3-methyladenine DNA glycosylase Tag